MKRLVGRITALFCFNSFSVNRRLPFFKILIRASQLQWDKHYEKAFHELKDYLGELSILTKPCTGEKLWVYLTTSEVVVSAVIVLQEEGRQYPVYYISYLFKGVEFYYIGLEK